MTTSPAEGIRYTMRAHFFLWRFCGLLPRPNDNPLYTLYSRTMHLNSMLFVGFILLSFRAATSLADCIQVLLLSTTFVLIIVKAFIFRTNYARVLDTLRLMRKLELTTVDRPTERKLLRGCYGWCRRMLVLMSFFCYFGCLSIAIEPLMGGEKLIYPSLYPFDWLSSRTLYYVTFFYQVFSNVTIVVFFPTADVYGPVMYLHLATYVEILCGRLQELGGCGGEMMGGGRGDVNRQELIECVKYHSMCLR